MTCWAWAHPPTKCTSCGTSIPRARATCPTRITAAKRVFTIRTGLSSGRCPGCWTLCWRGEVSGQYSPVGGPGVGQGPWDKARGPHAALPCGYLVEKPGIHVLARGASRWMKGGAAVHCLRSVVAHEARRHLVMAACGRARRHPRRSGAGSFRRLPEKNLENMVNKRNGNTIGARLRTRARAKGWVVGRDVDGRFEPEAGSRPAPGGAGVAGSRVRAGHGPAAGVALGRRVATSANPWADAQVGASPGAGGGADADADVGSVAAARSGAVR